MSPNKAQSQAKYYWLIGSVLLLLPGLILLSFVASKPSVTDSTESLRVKYPFLAKVNVPSGQSEEEFIGSLSPDELARLERKANKAPKPYTNAAEAQEFFLLQRTGGEPIDYSRIQAARDQMQVLPNVKASSAGFVLDGTLEAPSSRALGDIDSWTELGPGNIGGRTRTVLINPNNNQIMYAAGVAGGVWKTTDGGASWAPLNDLMINLAVVTLAFAGQGSGSVNTNILYAGTGEGFFNGDSVRGAGIFKSTDAGATWSQLAATNNSDFYYVNKIVASPNNVNTLYAAANSGVYKTTDAGANWSAVLTNDGLGGSNDTGGFARTQDIEIRTDVSPDTMIVSANYDGIFRTTNAGTSWSQVFTHANAGRSDLAIAPSNQDIMYALVADRFNGNRVLNVYRSPDGGATWNPKIAGAFNASNKSWLLLSNPLFTGFGQGWYDNIIAVAPHRPNALFAGGVDLFRSDNGGTDWGQISYWHHTPGTNGYAHADQHAITFDPGWDGSANQTMIVGNDGGMQKTTSALASKDTGAGASTVVWTVLNNDYGVTQFYNGRPLPSGTTYFGGTQDNGTIKGTDGGGINGWTEIYGGDGGYVSYAQSNNNVYFAETQNLNILRSTNAGGSFSGITNNISASGFAFIVPFRIDPSNDDHLWIGGDRAWRSNNATSAASAASVTWTEASTLWGGSVSAWAIDPNNSDSVWVASGSTLRHTDSATTATSATVWTNVTPPSSQYVSWIEVDENDATGNTAYFTSSWYNSSGLKVFKTTNRGAIWTDITNNLPDIPTHCIVVRPGQPGALFVGTELGVFASQDGGATWANMNSSGFANTVVETLEFQDSKTLYAFTHGRGAYSANIETDGLSVTGTDLVTIGNGGASFSPSNTTYTLENTGLSSLNWSVTDDTYWLNISPSSGTLASGAATNVTVSVNSLAGFIAIGITENATVTFTNNTSGNAQDRPATLYTLSLKTMSFNLETDPGWTTEGAWALGTPTGQGSGNGDPTSGHSGSNVYGFNLNGDYGNNLGELSLTTTALDFSSSASVTLHYWRWLAIESSSWDHAKVQVSNNGSSWIDVWTHTGDTVSDNQWVEESFDISATAAGQSTVYIRWVMGSTDISVTYPGWNIDDISFPVQPPPMRSEVWVDFAYTGIEFGTQAQPYNTFDEARRHAIPDGNSVIKIKGNTAQSSSSESATVLRPVTIQAISGTVQVGTP